MLDYVLNWMELDLSISCYPLIIVLELLHVGNRKTSGEY